MRQIINDLSNVIQEALVPHTVSPWDAKDVHAVCECMLARCTSLQLQKFAENVKTKFDLHNSCHESEGRGGTHHCRACVRACMVRVVVVCACVSWLPSSRYASGHEWSTSTSNTSY